MNEFAMALWAMTAKHHQWPMPPVREPVPVVRQERTAAPPATLPPEEREQLRQALERMAPRLTGRLVWDPEARMCVPELKPETEKR